MARILAAFRNWILRIGGRPALIRDGEPNEYKYKLKEDGCWIAVGQLSVHIIKTDEGVVVDVYGLHHEADDAIASTQATFDEADQGGRAMKIPTTEELQEFANKILKLVHWRTTVRVKSEPSESHPSWYVFYLNDVPSGALEMTVEYEWCMYILHPNVIQGEPPYVEEELAPCDSLGAALHELLAGMMDCQIDAAIDTMPEQ